MTRIVKLAVIAGDGIGPEVTREALKVLDVVTLESDTRFEFTHFSLGADRFLDTGDVLPEAELEHIASHDAIILGAIGGVPGDPRLAEANIERGLLLGLRFALDHHVNLRPSTLFSGVESPLRDPGAIDFVVVREGTEGPYVGNGGTIRQGTAHEMCTEVSLNTAYGVERVVRFAFELASSRERKKLTLVHKTNVLVFAGSLWSRIVAEVSLEFPDVTHDYLHVDAATIFLTTDPSRFDVIVTDNLFGDILTDLAAAVTGGIGLAASANLNPSGAFPSMFEPVHGSAPDIAGTGKADPSAAILSISLMLEHLGYPVEAQRVRDAVSRDIASRGDRKRSTEDTGSDIVALLSATV